MISPVLDSSLLCDTFEYRPYVDGTYAAVAASLSGGSASTWLVNTAASWMEALGLTPPSRDALYSRFTTLGLKSFDSDLEIKPHFLGERHDPSLKASISGIDLDNFTPGKVAAALARGVVRNLKSMLPEKLLEGKREIVGSGNAIRRSQLMQKIIEENFNLPLRISEGQEEAACGAALLAERALK